MLVPTANRELPITRPLVHSTKYHCAQDGPLPKATWVKSVVSRPVDRETFVLAYEIVLSFSHGRGCTIYRTWGDFEMLRNKLAPNRHAGTPYSRDETDALHGFLRDALRRHQRRNDLRGFLKRRPLDCECGLWNQDSHRM